MISNFPRINEVSDGLICRRVDANINGQEGWFYGAVNEKSLLPDGMGVLKTDAWIHCGNFISD